MINKAFVSSNGLNSPIMVAQTHTATEHDPLLGRPLHGGSVADEEDHGSSENEGPSSHGSYDAGNHPVSSPRSVAGTIALLMIGT
jgi:hypothetical protein